MAADFVLEIFKIIRGYGGAAVCATQDLNDFFALEGGKYGRGILQKNPGRNQVLLLFCCVERYADAVPPGTEQPLAAAVRRTAGSSRRDIWRTP